MKRISHYLFILWVGVFLLQACASKRISQGKTPISVATIAPQGEGQKSPSMQVSTPPQEKEKQNKLAQKISSLQRGKNAILLVAFGSTWQEAHNAYNALQRELTRTFNSASTGKNAPQDVYLAFTSGMCIQRCQQKGLGDFYSPHTWLAALAQTGYTSIVVQSLHVAQGKEYLDLAQEVNTFTQAHPSIDVALQGPLLDHAPEVAKILYKSYERELKAGATLLFMGHGTPKKYDIGARRDPPSIRARTAKTGSPLLCCYRRYRGQSTRRHHRTDAEKGNKRGQSDLHPSHDHCWRSRPQRYARGRRRYA